jgi:hypothetical protein
LLRADQQRKWWYFEHNVGALIQGDFATQANVACQLRAAKIITQNEARRTFNLNQVDGGDEFENPNVSPGPSSSQATTAAADVAPKAILAHRELIADRMRQLVRSERTACKRLVKSKCAIQSLENFYGTFKCKVSAALEVCIQAYMSLGIDGIVPSADVVAERYCSESMRLLVDGLSRGDSAIEEITADWEERRPGEVVAMITGGN